MIAIVAKFTVDPDKAAEFEAVFQGLVAKVRAKEPGNRLYQLARSRAAAGVYVVMELYADEAALEAHRANEDLKATFPQLRPFFTGAPVIEYCDTVD
jgi:quinol monooxygenase YgiN